MPSAVMTVRFPNGETQFRTTSDPLKPGHVMKSRGERWIVSTVVKAKDGSSVVTTGGAPFGHATNSECMSLLLRRWRQWVSPAARRGRRATKGE